MNKWVIALLIAALLALFTLAIAFPPVPVDDPIAAAKELLVKNDIPVPPYTIEVVHSRPSTANVDVAAWVYSGTHVIFILDTTPTWKDAKAGDEGALEVLAAMIVHEGVHASGDMSENDAYDAEIAALEKMGADHALVEGVERAKEDALR